MSINIRQKMTALGLVALTLSLGVAAGAAQAGVTYCGGGGTQPPCPTWTFGAGGTNLTGSASTSTGFLTSEAQTNSHGVGVPSATATAWSNTGDNNTNTALQAAYIGAYGHMGVTDAQAGKPTTLGSSGQPLNADTSSANFELNSPNHAIDNSANVDSTLFTFTGGPVNLTSFTTGWQYNDADYTVLAYTGLGCIGGCSTNMSGLTYSQLLSKGWALIGNYYVSGPGAGVTYNGNTTYGFANTTLSSYWLIGALNQWVGGDAAQAGNDYFKILSVTGCDCSTNPNLPGCNGKSVPEPGTLLLMSAGLIGLTRINRRRTANNA